MVGRKVKRRKGVREDRRGQGRWGREDGKKEQQIKMKMKGERGPEIDKAELHCTLYPDAMMQLSAYF